MAVGGEDGDAAGRRSIVGNLASVWQYLVGGSEAPRPDKQFRLGKAWCRQECQQEKEKDPFWTERLFFHGTNLSLISRAKNKIQQKGRLAQHSPAADCSSVLKFFQNAYIRQAG